MKRPETEDLARADDVAKLRQVQLQGRRYAISIEPLFWDCLEEAAKELGLRLNKLVGLIASADEGPGNLAARLRLYCVRRLRRQLQSATLTPRQMELPALIEAISNPCFVVDERQQIVLANEGILRSIAEPLEQVVGDPVQKYFRIRFSEPQADAWTGFTEGNLAPVAGTLAYMIPGQVMARRFTGIPVKGSRKGRYYCIFLIK